ncbi:hypothetical protein CAPTEDRAFT_194506 [Capitella teleta]|uniref:C-type lectin domain-containing protein n=1 Tax=Capitella teleta TaxID=283909 RepID=R7TDL9_CAPTE|nr:hypothetical protein CAPTEDRAFT_194506 [Capitella teleta]|eukprot:ELT89166.1 hypothetical protein CAPTEDRAFT_194506 [Capitella teleta]
MSSSYLAISCFVTFIILALGQPVSNNCPLTWRLWSGSCYRFFQEQSLNFSSAHRFCVDHGGRLAVVDSKHDNAFVLALCKSESNCPVETWIGLHKEGNSWVWTDSSPAGWTNWYENIWGSMNESTGDGKCAIIWTNTVLFGEGKWGSKDCGSEFPFLCEHGRVIPEMARGIDYSYPYTWVMETTEQPNTVTLAIFDKGGLGESSAHFNKAAAVYASCGAGVLCVVGFIIFMLICLVYKPLKAPGNQRLSNLENQPQTSCSSKPNRSTESPPLKACFPTWTLFEDQKPDHDKLANVESVLPHEGPKHSNDNYENLQLPSAPVEKRCSLKTPPICDSNCLVAKTNKLQQDVGHQDSLNGDYVTMPRVVPGRADTNFSLTSELVLFENSIYSPSSSY